MTVRRGGKDLSLRFRALGYAAREKTSPRSCSFPAVFDTDARLARDECGGPLVNGEGQVVGITIALPVPLVSGSSAMPRVFVVPAAIARGVADHNR